MERDEALHESQADAEAAVGAVDGRFDSAPT
jgi:hypothetical protein